MGLMDYLQSQLIDIIEWTDDSRDTISWRFPDEDKEIKRGAQLIVRESQTAQFVYVGEFGDTFGPGRHTLTTENIPILTSLRSWKYGFESPFKADVYFVNTRLFTGNKWGTSNPVMLRDQDFGIVRVRAFGTYDFRVVNVPLFLKEVAGSDHNFRLDEFADTMRSRLVSVFSEALASAKVPVLDLAMRYSELGAALLPLVNAGIVQRYGIELQTFVVENCSVPPEVEAAIDARSSMSAVGNLTDYVKFQMAQGMGQPGGGGAAGSAAELAVGFAVAQQMMQQPGGMLGGAPPVVAPPVVGGGAPPVAPPVVGGAGVPPAPAAGVAGVPALLTPADVATALGVTEADVIATLEAGDLKGKRIGSAWRITRAALDEFLAR